MLSFEEFQAVNARQKSKELLKEQLNSKNDSKSTGAKTIKGDKAASAAPPGPSSKDGSSRTTFSTMSFGDFLELNQLQILIVVLILLDSFAAMVEIYIRSLQLEMLENADVTAAFQAFTTLSVKIVTGALHAFAQFNLLMFALEILAILVAFNVSLVGHLGYTLDILVISAQIYMETFKGLGRETRILNVFRLWRLFRLLNSLIEIETSKHEVTKGELQKKVDAVQRFETDIARMEGDLKSERQVRASVETMLQGYKEEVDTLNEALRIAAMDIAEVAQADEDEFLSDEDYDENDVEDVEDDYEGHDGHDILGSNTQRAGSTSKDVLYREAMRDVKPGKGFEGSSTFVVHEDGSYERK